MQSSLRYPRLWAARFLSLSGRSVGATSLVLLAALLWAMPVSAQDAIGVIVQKPSVLVVHAPGSSEPGYSLDVQTKLNATNQFSFVGLFDARTGTPTLAQLQAYNAVLLFSNDPFSDPTALGNNLAAYVDGGQGVVKATFALLNGIIVTGNFANAPYVVLTNGNLGAESRTTLGTVAVPAHPIMNGVTSFSGGSSSFRVNNSVSAGSTLIASWSDNIPLVAVKENVGPGNARRADLNFFPPSSTADSRFWDATTDGAKIMANALVWVSASSIGLSTSASASPNPACTTSMASVTASGGTAPYSYTWVAPAGITLTGGSTSAVQATAGAGVSGVQTLTVTVADAATPSLTATAQVSLTFNTPTTVSISGNQELSCGQSLTLTASGNGTSYTWSDNTFARPVGITDGDKNGGVVIVSKDNARVVVRPAQTGTVYSVTATNRSTGCSAVASVTATLAPTLAAQAISTTVISELSANNCPVLIQSVGTGNAFVFTNPVTGTVYSTVYRNGGTYNLPAVPVKQPGTYTMTAYYTDACGTTSTNSRTFVVTGTGCN